ncbi:Pyridoxine/pyridoxamine 5'-phosphate oxidase [Methylobacterium dankookense]|jgi:pyridoxamine 5'-phosphate oxidase|uniref:Pyridoxine/pyridoxamine 5'-phosphate oxidase n=2 Tax=Methylobacterium dankookense TaxID=560405 RepID=A0A564G116_9HYPH|nr:Pyridoxine/pyridoxamine 5'-phosphate oxidase [Methylobacterium dankookense]VUF13804.1 Pyridoxine/pyridoxamine 5'-phosphate oxidase [Methylobacterium dankookense]
MTCIKAGAVEAVHQHPNQRRDVPPRGMVMTEILAATVADGEGHGSARDGADDFTCRADPWELFREWMSEAKRTEPNDPHAMALATTGADGMPDVRIMLLKSYDERGFVFFTNDRSAKGAELGQNAQAAIVLHWKSLRRQVRARGAVAPVSPEESDAYFASRPRESRVGAVASRQSQPLADRATLLREVDAVASRSDGKPVPRPAHWRGFRIIPVAFEFWQDRAYRLHDRVRFASDGALWTRTRLYP